MTKIMTLREFIDCLVLESLHPELHAIITAPPQKNVSKRRLMVDKVKELTVRGEKTGITRAAEGSSRAYLMHDDHEDVSVDGHHTKLQIGTKMAIPAPLDPYHDKESHGGMTLGQLQNKAEGADPIINDHYRVLRKSGKGKFESNNRGIFPPLIDHDNKTHEWSQVGHTEDVTYGKFKLATKTKDFPNGIEHDEFMSALTRAWNKKHGNYWKQSPEEEKHLDKLDMHPLVDKFATHQNEFHAPPHDYDQIENMGIWHHPVTGETHVVARDHGYNEEVMQAYKRGFSRQIDRKRYRDPVGTDVSNKYSGEPQDPIIPKENKKRPTAPTIRN